MAGALLFWGWENHHLLPLAVGLAAALEASHWIGVRWELANKDLNRISDLCWMLFVAASLFLYTTTTERAMFVFKLAQWLPVCFFPLMLAQAYGNRETMPLSVFSWLLRRSPASPTALKSYNISYCYFAVCLLAASAATGNPPNGFFYLGVTLLVVLGLTSTRPKRVSIMVWIMMVSAVAVGGQLGHEQLHRLQEMMERALGPWMALFLRSTGNDAMDRPTHIGIPGPLPHSSRIVLRIRPEPGAFVPSLLREAVWDSWNSATESWSASNGNPGWANRGESDFVKLMPSNRISSEIEIARYYDDGKGILPLPHGTFEIDDMPGHVQTNRLGTVLMENGPGLADFRASFGPGRSIDSPPTPRDLSVDPAEEPVISNIVSELNLRNMTERQKIRAIERYFAANFTYTLAPPRHRDNQLTWMGYFLTKSHAGHCEYFSTATVLLLREAGVSARWVTGFAVPESARKGDTYLVRERHAHAWSLAYNTEGKYWEQVDTTPGDWNQADRAEVPWWDKASDEMSNLYFQFSKWRWGKTSVARYAIWLTVPLILYLVARILLNQRRHRPAVSPDDSLRPAWPGSDSELYLINRRLESAQLSRLTNEPLLAWQERLEAACPGPERLRRIFHLHRSLRFDPRGLKQGERDQLRDEAQRWLSDFNAWENTRAMAALSAP